MKIDFEFTTPHGLFRDALHLPDDHTLTDAEIQAMKQQRVDGWIAVVTAPPIEEVAEEFIEIDGVRYAKVV
ncbi:hypothetical protein UFOVP376_55 [uncultured Caudovirales phage]|uniref:Uncharacterized protein n=1 Tax=uncultured Caudovirales phage TaxID=2100421 RepID=A0A6J7WZ89_9CAUD|nr:hypothetical protein UFOVP376_55 [uncultured Caudovirales phage]